MDIRISERNVYGNEMLYPANPAAETLARIAGKKTLTMDVLRSARALGHTITVENARGVTRKQIEEINGAEQL
jgi:hypothetical protein